MKRDKALFDEMIFPGGKEKAFTMSYDDGTIHDRRLVEIMNRHHIKGTFNLNSGFFDQKNDVNGPQGTLDLGRVRESEVVSLYRGHEIAGHGLNHASPTDIGTAAFLYETVEDKAALERLCNGLIRGYAYPFGFYNDDIKKILSYAGYHYARVVDTTGGFGVPEDFMEWKGTCHHNDPKLMELAGDFCREEMYSMHKKIFYLWGHSYEFEAENTWPVIEAFLEYMEVHGENIWFATNGELCDYINGYRKLEYSADASMIYNPGARTVFFRRDGQVYMVEPLQTIHIQ